MTTLLLLSNNLMFLPRIQQAAGSTVSIVRASNLDRLTELISEGNIDMVVADLEYDQDFGIRHCNFFRKPRILIQK